MNAFRFIAAHGDDHCGNLWMIVQVGADFAYGDAGGARHGETVGAGRDGGEGDGPGTNRGGQAQAGAVAGGKQLVFVLGPAMPDGADGVDDKGGREAEAGSDARFASGTAADGTS